VAAFHARRGASAVGSRRKPSTRRVNRLAIAAIVVMGLAASAWIFAVQAGELLAQRAWAVLFIVALFALALSLNQ
jgi:hypothetical protein